MSKEIIQLNEEVVKSELKEIGGGANGVRVFPHLWHIVAFSGSAEPQCSHRTNITALLSLMREGQGF